MNEVRLILSASKCRPMILVSRNIRYMQIFPGVPRGGTSNYSGLVDDFQFSAILVAAS